MNCKNKDQKITFVTVLLLQVNLASVFILWHKLKLVNAQGF